MNSPCTLIGTYDLLQEEAEIQSLFRLGCSDFTRYSEDVNGFRKIQEQRTWYKRRGMGAWYRLLCEWS